VSTALLLLALATASGPSPGGADERDWHEPRTITTAQAPETPPAKIVAIAEAMNAPAPAPKVVPVSRPAPPRLPAFASQLPFAGETTRYRIAYGLLGDLGEVTISFSFPTDAVHAVGSGSGSFFGLGRIEKSVESDLVQGKDNPRRWVTSRIQSGKTIVDTVEQATPGQIAVLRRRSDRPEEGHHFSRQIPVMDPLAFLWRLRSQPPTRPETFEVLDGRALWTIVMSPTRVQADGPKRTVLILTGKADPIFWDGRPDDDRTGRTFKLYLEGDAQHTPLRLVMPLAVGEVRVDLTSVSHASARSALPTATAAASQIAAGPVPGTRAALVKAPAR
jgi:hypothetical protein